MSRLDGFYAIVTGASAGIGKFICRALIKDFPGLKVVGLARREVSDIDSPNFGWIKCDVSNAQEIQSVFTKIGQDFGAKKCVLLVNNAGHAKPVPLLSDERLLDVGCLKADALETNAAFSSMLNVNVLGLALTTRLGVELMDHQVPGNIVNINSMSGQRVANSVATHFYSCTKYAVTALTEGTRQELRALNSKIRIGQISPGFVETDFFQAMNATDEAFKAKMDKICEIALQSEDIYAALKMMIEADPRCQVGDVQIRPTHQLS